MPKLTTLASLCLIVSACQFAPASFTSMNDSELIAYNAGKPVMEQVICTAEATTSTFIRKRRCKTYEEIIHHNEKAMMTLEVMNTGEAGFKPRTMLNDGPR